VRLAEWESLPRDSAQALAWEREWLAWASDRENLARRNQNRAEEFRARLLRARVLLVRGERPAPLAAPRTRIEYVPGEALLAAELLADGPERARAARLALDEPRLAALLPGIARAERLALRLDSALALSPPESSGERRHERLRALSQAGRVAEALEELRLRPLPLEDYALQVDLELAADQPAAARRVLGAALAAGVAGVELALARRELAQGRPQVARELAQSVLAKSPQDRDAWECFSFALLPPPRSAPAANASALSRVPSQSPSKSP